MAAVVERMKGINKILRIEANAVERFVHLSVATETCAVRTFFRDLQLADAVRTFSLFLPPNAACPALGTTGMLLLQMNIIPPTALLSFQPLQHPRF